MAFLDFMKTKQTVPNAQGPPPKQEAAPNAVQSLSAAQRLSVEALSETLRKATAHIETKATAIPTAGGDSATNAALLQKQSNQEKVQAALSPTDKANGKTATMPTKNSMPRGR